MALVEEIRKRFAEKLDHEVMIRKLRLEDEAQQFRNRVSSSTKSFNPDSVIASVQQIQSSAGKNRQSPPPLPLHPNALIDMTNSDPLRELDRTFINMFHLPQYFPTNKLSYPTILCEGLEEFFTPFLSGMNYSQQTRDQELKRLISEAQEVAKKHKGGIFGVNFPGQGCYLNGWLFAYLANIQTNQVMTTPSVFQKVLGTAAHEKLGHGFLSVYSSLGEIKTNLGLTLVQIADQFGLAASDDAMARLRYQQNSLLFTVSQFLEEGWATWIENYLKGKLFQSGTNPSHSIEEIIQAVEHLPAEIKNVNEVKESFLSALGILLGDEDQTMGDILQSIRFLAYAGGQLDDYFSSQIRQPLRYALGELLCMQCESNLGVECVPYAALIAGNITFDPVKISVSDLSNLLSTDPRLNPDARLAAVSRIKLEKPGSVKELSQKVSSLLSFSIPVELR